MTVDNELISELFPILEDQLSADELLACPHCGGGLLHTDKLWIVKNEAIWCVDLGNAKDPVMRGLRPSDKPPVSTADDYGHRYVLALQAWCEECPVDTSWVFTQVKGSTKMTRRAAGQWEAA